MPRPYREALLAPEEEVALIAGPHALTFWLGATRRLLLAIVAVVLAVVVEQTTLLPPALAPYRPYLTLGLLVLAAIAVGAVLIGWARWRAHEIVVTDRRVIRIAGIVSKDVVDYSLDAITDLRLRQSWLGRILDYGDVDILTASESASHPRDTFPVVAGPIRFMHAVQQEREARRRRFADGPGAFPSRPFGTPRAGRA